MHKKLEMFAGIRKERRCDRFSFYTKLVQLHVKIYKNSLERVQLNNVKFTNTYFQECHDLFNVLYQTWCHNPVATVALCLLSQKYQHASQLIKHLYPFCKLVKKSLIIKKGGGGEEARKVSHIRLF